MAFHRLASREPAPGARFYPIYTLAKTARHCWFQQGGPHTPSTTNTFFVTYPDVGFKPIRLAEDFHRDLGGNPCSGA